MTEKSVRQKLAAKSLALLLRFGEVLVLGLGPDTMLTGFSCFSTVLPGERRDNTCSKSITACFRVISKSLFVNHSKSLFLNHWTLTESLNKPLMNGDSKGTCALFIGAFWNPIPSTQYLDKSFDLVLAGLFHLFIHLRHRS